MLTRMFNMTSVRTTFTFELYQQLYLCVVMSDRYIDRLIAVKIYVIFASYLIFASNEGAMCFILKIVNKYFTRDGFLGWIIFRGAASTSQRCTWRFPWSSRLLQRLQPLLAPPTVPPSLQPLRRQIFDKRTLNKTGHVDRIGWNWSDLIKN